MTALRQRMIEDMQLRNLSQHTIDAYVLAVKQFANHFGQSPERLTGEQVREYLLHLVQEKRVSWSRYNLARCGLQFLYQITLGRDERVEKIPCARVPKRLPTVLERRTPAAVRCGSPQCEAQSAVDDAVRLGAARVGGRGALSGRH